MDDDRPPRLLPSLVLFVVGAIVVLMLVSWVIGTVFAILRLVFVVGVAVAVIWAIMASRADR